MKPNPFDQPAPALFLALGAAVLSHKATANAARVVGVPIAALSLLLAGALAVGGLQSD
ncbi:MAG TPA: hypothetical protein VFU11_12950 [Solirubrobacterales bacterium]|nr:hypothetical protein [Solirubrobacterales bacterium]